MKKPKILASAGIGVAMLAVGYGLWNLSDQRLEANGGGFLRNGEAGFVVTRMNYAWGPNPLENGACPDGSPKNVTEIFAETEAGRRRPGETDEGYAERLEEGGKTFSVSSKGDDYCLNPELAPRDTHMRTMLDATIVGDGIDLDGKISRSADDVKSGRLDFVGPDGRRGVDNQFRRIFGCHSNLQLDGRDSGLESEIYTGAWGVLISLSGVDDLKNDDDVTVGIFANEDPIMLSPSRKPLVFATYAMDDDENFRAYAKGRIVNGVLTTDPVDVKLRDVINSMYLVRYLRDARIEATLSSDGVLSGILGGYTPAVSLYDNSWGFRAGKDANGKPADIKLRKGSAHGAARVMGHTCQGIYQAMHDLADGHPDPKTGRFTSISTQYRFEARPAFVVEPPVKN